MFASWFFDFHRFTVEVVGFSGFLDYDTLLASAIADVDDCGVHFVCPFFGW